MTDADGDRLPVAVVSLSPQGIVTAWSRAAERLLGYGTNEIAGRAIATLGRDDSLARAVDRLRQAQAFQSLCFATRLKAKDGTEAPVFLCLDAVKDQEGSVQEIVATARDLRTTLFEAPHEGARSRLTVPDGSALSGLTPRQRVVLELISRGYSTREIARRLGRSVKTVETHRAQLMRRLNIHHVPGLVAFAIRVGLVTIE